MTQSLIRGRYVVCRATGNDIEMIDDGAILQRDGEIIEIGTAAVLRQRHPGVSEIGSRDHVVIPGLVNAHHHVGTTRMHQDPRRDVVDANGSVHGTPNLFTAGSSVFPTGATRIPRSRSSRWPCASGTT